MKTTSKKIMTAGLAALSLALADAQAQMSAPQSSADNTNSRVTSANAENTYDNNSTEGGLPKADRASCVIGMVVRNQNNERLGKIKDVVFDPRSERVAYAVMAASGTGMLGMQEKLLAVPLNAFTPSADDKYLILRADKARVEAATGIDRKAWPSASNPSWGAQPFWQSDHDRYQNNGANPDRSQFQPQGTRSDYQGTNYQNNYQGGQYPNTNGNAQGNFRNYSDGMNNSTNQRQDNSGAPQNLETHPRSND
jgi:sporulation protein YlmC with PRC-barrel domain